MKLKSKSLYRIYFQDPAKLKNYPIVKPLYVTNTCYMANLEI